MKTLFYLIKSNLLLKVIGIFALIFSFSLSSFAQGCMPIKYIPPNLGTQGLSYLTHHKWELTLSYRYLKSNTVFIGTEEQGQFTTMGVEPRMNSHAIDISGRYRISNRFSVSLNIPLILAEESYPHADGVRHTLRPGVQIADVRILGNYWLFDPLKAGKSNVAISMGVKIPTGRSDLDGDWHTPNGVITRDFDVALQPGDGGWAIIIEAFGLHRFTEALSVYFSGSYLINPRNTNFSEPPWSNPPNRFTNSVPDQYFLRGGLTTSFANFSLSTGLRFDGMPVEDLIGDSDGFRRPGYILYLDPGLIWSDIINTINLNVPIALHRNLQTSLLHRGLGVQTGGGLADFFVTFSYSRRF